jgi:hypothetical protein
MLHKAVSGHHLESAAYNICNETLGTQGVLRIVAKPLHYQQYTAFGYSGEAVISLVSQI